MSWRRPPNQNLIRRKEHWPVLGETEPAPLEEPWSVRLEGCVERPATWSIEALRAHPSWTERSVDIHCVTRWSKLDCRFAGPRLLDLIEEAGPAAEAESVRFVAHTERRHDTSLTLADIQRHDPIVALDYDGAPLEPIHGGPARIVTPGKYFYKSCKWIARIEIRRDHQLGYWESGPGYHDGADPWREERYVTGSVSPELREKMIKERRFGGRDLRSCVFDGEDLEGLEANGATLRNASFVGARLVRANFEKCFLVNARMMKADLRGARFSGCDVMGVDFREADLAGADLSGARLFGASFCADDGGEGARFDQETRLPEEQLNALTDSQSEYVRAALASVR